MQAGFRLVYTMFYVESGLLPSRFSCSITLLIVFFLKTSSKNIPFTIRNDSTTIISTHSHKLVSRSGIQQPLVKAIVLVLQIHKKGAKLFVYTVYTPKNIQIFFLNISFYISELSELSVFYEEPVFPQVQSSVYFCMTYNR